MLPVPPNGMSLTTCLFTVAVCRRGNGLIGATIKRLWPFSPKMVGDHCDPLGGLNFLGRDGRVAYRHLAMPRPDASRYGSTSPLLHCSRPVASRGCTANHCRCAKRPRRVGADDAATPPAPVRLASIASRKKRTETRRKREDSTTRGYARLAPARLDTNAARRGAGLTLRAIQHLRRRHAADPW
jgi:hypothetical protein